MKSNKTNFQLFIILAIINLTLSQSQVLIGSYQTSNPFTKEFKNSEWNNNLDFAFYGWLKITTFPPPASWSTGFHFTSNSPDVWTDQYNYGDRVLAFFNDNNNIINPTYTTYSANPSTNIWSQVSFSTPELNQWIFIYLSYGSQQQAQYAYYKFPSHEVRSKLINIVHSTSNYYYLYVGKTSPYYYFMGQICGFYLIAGPTAYRESGFDQFLTLQTQDAISCSYCLSDFYIPQQTCVQWCPNNYRANIVQKTCDQCSTYTSDCQTCAPTCKSCQFGNKDICLDCQETMNISNGTCVCKNGIDNRNIFYQCSNDNIAVLQANLASDSPTLTINFGVPLKNNNFSCSQIFQPNTLGQLGSNPVCTINQANITIALSQDANITETQQISFLPNVLQYQGNNNFINTFYLFSFNQLKDIPFQMNYKYDEIQNTCYDITFQLIPQNDAKRGFNSIVWSIQAQPTLDSQIQLQVDNIVKTANDNINPNLIIPKYLIPSNTNIKATVNYFMRVNVNGTLSFSTLYQKYYQIVIQTIQSAQPPVYRYMDLTFKFNLYTQVCDQTGSVIVFEPYDIQIISQVLPNLNQSYYQTSQQDFQVNVQKYEIPFNTAFDLQVSAVLDSNKTISQQTNINITPQLSKLLVQITSGQGGQNGLFNYKKDLNLTGTARDLEIQDPNIPQGINLSWQCQSLIQQQNGERECLDYNNNTVTLAQNSLSTVVPAYTFIPYQTLQFSLVGSKDTRTSFSNITAIIAEIDIPPLFVQFRDISQLQQVNLNDDIFVTLQYGSDISSDDIQYAGAVLYNNAEVGIIKFDFYEVKFRIWDYFNSVTPDNPVVQVRFTAYNPSFYMPSMTTKKFNINLPPANCVFTVSPTSGKALETIFNIQMSGCTSSDNSLTYQFFYYQNNSDFQQEILVPNNILRRQIQDQSLESQLNTVLPSGNLTIMGQVMNSKLSIFNSTLEIKVTPFDQGEQQINNIIDQMLQQLNSQYPRQSLLNLCFLGEEISKNNPVYQLNSVNYRKSLVISQIISQTNSLPKQSNLFTYSNKVISQLQLSLNNQQDSQSLILLNYINQTLENTILLMQDSSNLLLNNNNNIVLQNLVDSFKMLNSTTKIISYSLLPNQMNLSDQICGLLANITLPNTGGIQLQGNLIELNCQQITEKNLNQYIDELDYFQTKTTNIYRITYSTYSQNPYSQTTEFLNYTDQLQILQPNITISKNPVIIPQIEYVNSNKRFLSINNSSLNQNSTYIYTFSNVNKSQNKLTCLQKQVNQWSSSNCQELNRTGTSRFYCYCKDKTPTTITDNLEELIKNKNLQTAFSSQGFNNISNFKNFYKYAAFWILSTATLILIGLYFYGKHLDRKFIFHSIQRIAPATAIDNGQSLINLQNRIKANQQNKGGNNTNRNEIFSQNQLIQQENKNLYLQYGIDSQQQIINNIKVESNKQFPFQETPFQTTINTPDLQLIKKSKQENQEIQNINHQIQIVNLNDQQDYNRDDLQHQQQKQQQKQIQQWNGQANQQKQNIQQQDSISNQQSQLDNQFELQLQKFQNQIGTLETITKIVAQPFSTLNLQQKIQQETKDLQIGDKQLHSNKQKVQNPSESVQNTSEQNFKNEADKQNEMETLLKQLNDQNQSQVLIGSYSTGNSYTKEFKNSEWNTNLDFAFYGWFKITSFPTSFWSIGFHFTSNAPNVWNDKYNYGDRLLTFHNDNNNLINPTYTTYSANPSPNVWNEAPYSTSDFNQWIFIYLSYGSQQQAQYVYYKFPSREVGQKLTNIIHNTSNYYYLFVGITKAPYTYFIGQICGLYLIAGPTAYRESGFDQFLTLQTQDAVSCSYCLSDFYIPQQTCGQWCPNNYRANLVQKTCDQCSTYTSDCQTCATTCRSCKFGNKNICLDCYETMNISNGTCVCKNGIDKRNIFYQCSNDNTAVLQANLASDTPTLTVNFEVPLQNNNLSCSQIFQPKTLGQLGSNPVCTISQANITIALSQDANITETQQISFLPNVLQYQGNNKLINTFYLFSFTQLKDIPFQMNYNYDEIQNTCNDITFQLIPQNDAKRGFNSIVWSIQTQPTLDSQIQLQVDKIVKTANDNVNPNLIIPKYLIPPNTNIKATVNYFMRVNVNGTLSFSTLYQKYKQIVIQTIQGAQPPIYRYMDLTFKFYLYTQVCDQTGSIIVFEPYDIQIISKILPNLNQSYNQTTQQDFQVNVKQYEIPFNTAFDLQVSAVLDSNKTISQQTNINITPQLSKLLVQITSGQCGQDGLFNYKKDLNLTGTARDLEIQDPNIPQGINLSWQCQSLIQQQNGERKCLDYRNNIVTLGQNSLSTAVPAYTFTPYQTLQFSLVGSKDTRTSFSNMTAIIAEIDIPPLFVQFQDISQLQQVNLNDDIFATLQYGSDISSDVIEYAGAVLYNNAEVGIIKFDFYEVKFRIWDYFNSVTPDNPVVQVRFTAYNPSFYMPSMTIKNFNINLPPANCVFTVSPTSGKALETQFSIQMSGCTSSDNALTYQFFYYQNNSDFKQEILAPNNILRRQIQDQSLANQLNTILPSGNLTIMGQVMNSKLSIFNSTVEIKVTPFDQGEQQINNIIDQTLQQQNSQYPRQSLLNLCYLGEEISKNNPVYQLNSVNYRKSLVISQIINQTSSLPKQSYLFTYSNKVISQLQLSLNSQQDSQSINLLNYINQTLENTMMLMQDSGNLLLNNNNVVLQNLVDSFKMLNSTTQSISDSLLPSQMNISDQICGLLANITLPNTGGIQLQGNLIELNCQQITEKNLNQYIYKLDGFQTKTTNIYSITYSTYSQNPYSQTSEFQNYTKQLQQLQPNITISKNPVIIPQIEYLNSNRRILSISNNNNLNQNSTYIYTFPNVSKSQNKLTCLQKQVNSWSSSKCQILNSTEMSGFQCYCKDKTPTTITDDLEQLIQNKNLQTAFSSQGFDNISNFKYFYKYAAFWTLSAVTLLLIGLFFYGKHLDRKFIFHSIQRIAPTPATDNDQSLINPQKRIQTNLDNKNENNTNRDENFSLNQLKQQENKYLYLQQGIDSQQQIINNINIQSNKQFPFQETPIYTPINTQDLQLIQQSQQENQEIQNIYNQMQIVNLDNQQDYNKDNLQLQQQNQQKNQLKQFQEQGNQQKQNIQQQDSLSNKSSQLDKQYEIQLQKFQNQIGTLETITKIVAQPFSTLNIQQNNYYTTQNNLNINNKQIYQQNNFEDYDNCKFQKEQQIQQQTKELQISDKQLHSNKQKVQNPGKSVQNSSEQNLKSEAEKQNEMETLQKQLNDQKQKLANKSLLIRIIVFHDFFNIFYSYDPKLSRAIRFNIFYLRIIHSLCLTTIFDESYNIDQKIILSIISSIILVTGVTIITLIHKIKIIGQKISAIFLICLLLFYYYIILSIISGEEANQANSKTLSFLLIVGIDFFGILTLMSVLKLSLVLYSQQEQSKQTLIKSLFKIFDLQILLQNLNV
ncbi:REJ domain protein (macronuclear) [Tetrahymena thermophila SB210]|uniref:REJ domain protein n=1 Tax=Tetrahymena thermophila (strain SB210) TaxID=312017 RepID=I7MJE7_TETTS|nr:REJ domain protein [Tetrahymena thermophila SB210]EAS06210.2 REJ domain protein [Tetrahymena thermophila SB210]|eukprot:XP_001026455.2 REJ domain protein [Tetrahymena thermophila SB210]